MKRAAQALIAIMLLCALLYAFQAQLFVFAHQALRVAAPCRAPIRYTIGDIDERFGLSRDDAASALTEAEAIWEEAAGTDLFAYDPLRATLAVDFRYDERQERTEILQDLDIEIDTTLESYESLQERYRTAEEDYTSKQLAFERDRALYDERVAAYEASVQRWNDHGGAPAEQYAALERERRSLEAETARLSERADAVNAAAREANAIGSALNSLARDVRVRAEEYNATIGEKEFEEAVYESAPGRESITVYEYGNRAELVRVLAHELGHSLGMDHVADQDAIMYELNIGDAMSAQDADVRELAAACRT